MLRLMILSVIGIVLSGHAHLSAQAVLTHPFYPLNVGDRWTYRYVDLKPGATKPDTTREIVITVDREEIYEIKDAKEKKDGKEKTTKHVGFILKNTSGGKSTEDHVVVLADGFHRVHRAGTVMNPPLNFFKLPLVDENEKWKANSVSGNEFIKGTFTWREAKVKVPSGAYEKTVAVLFTNDNKNENERVEVETWYAKDVGMVKQRVRQKGHEHALELVKYTPKK